MNAETVKLAHKYEASGWFKDRKNAVLAMQDAKRATPEHVRHLFHSRIIRFQGGYEWWWILK